MVSDVWRRSATSQLAHMANPMIAAIGHDTVLSSAFAEHAR
jgi:hypothetical protein